VAPDLGGKEAYDGGCTVTTANIPDDLIVVADVF
jgi:hypothetical protein